MDKERFDTAKITSLIASIRRNLALLDNFGKMPSDDFIGDFRNYHAALRLLQISIEGALSVGNHIVARSAWWIMPISLKF